MNTIINRCYARREFDEMYCHVCGLRWSVSEEKPEAAKCVASRDANPGAEAPQAEEK